MHMRHLTAAIVLSVPALTGCSGDTDTDETSASTVEPTVVDPSSSSTTSVSSTSSTSAAEHEGPPPEAQANTKEGAEAFAKWYSGEMGEATTDGYTSALRAHTDGGCKVCLRYIQLTEETAEQYGLVKENPHRVGIKESSQDEPGRWRVKTRIDYDRIEFIKDGKVQSFTDPGGFDLNLVLNRSAETWMTEDWHLVQ